MYLCLLITFCFVSRSLSFVLTTSQPRTAVTCNCDESYRNILFPNMISTWPFSAGVSQCNQNNTCTADVITCLGDQTCLEFIEKTGDVHLPTATCFTSAMGSGCAIMANYARGSACIYDPEGYYCKQDRCNPTELSLVNGC